MRHSNVDLVDDSAMHLGNRSLMVIDAEALHDAAREMVSRASLTREQAYGSSQFARTVVCQSHHVALGLQRNAVQ